MESSLRKGLRAVKVLIEDPRQGEFAARRGDATVRQDSRRNLYSLWILSLEETLYYQLKNKLL